MKDRIEQEVDRTLECMKDGLGVPVSPLFAEKLSRRIARVQVRRASGYGGRMSYAVVIVLLIALNVTAGLVSLKARQRVGSASSTPESVLAQEYGMGQNDLMSY